MNRPGVVGVKFPSTRKVVQNPGLESKPFFHLVEENSPVPVCKLRIKNRRFGPTLRAGSCNPRGIGRRVVNAGLERRVGDERIDASNLPGCIEPVGKLSTLTIQGSCDRMGIISGSLLNFAQQLPMELRAFGLTRLLRAAFDSLCAWIQRGVRFIAVRFQQVGV